MSKRGFFTRNTLVPMVPVQVQNLSPILGGAAPPSSNLASTSPFLNLNRLSDEIMRNRRSQEMFNASNGNRNSFNISNKSSDIGQFMPVGVAPPLIVGNTLSHYLMGGG